MVCASSIGTVRCHALNVFVRYLSSAAGSFGAGSHAANAWSQPWTTFGDSDDCFV